MICQLDNSNRHKKNKGVVHGEFRKFIFFELCTGNSRKFAFFEKKKNFGCIRESPCVIFLRMGIPVSKFPCGLEVYIREKRGWAREFP